MIKMQCPSCNCNLTLKQSSKGTGYLVHSNLSKCIKGESNVHFQAKLLLKHHLINGGKLNLVSKCPGERCYAKHCSNLDLSQYDQSKLRFELEYKLSSHCRVDLAILHEVDTQSIDTKPTNTKPNLSAKIFKVLALIEIYKTHRTAAGTERDAYPWYELSANKILVCNINEVTWKLTNARQHGCNRKPLCITNFDLAVQLGYYRQCYAHYYLRELHMAVYGIYQTFIQPWITEVSLINQSLLEEARRRKTCLCCRKPCLKSKFIFCKSCYATINRQRVDLINTWKIEASQQIQLQRKYQWLLQLPTVNICNCRSTKLIQYYGSRSICEHCFVNHQYQRDLDSAK